MRTESVITEYERLQALCQDADPARRVLAEGPLQELAKMRVELDKLNDIALRSGLVLVDPSNPARQKELPVSRALTKLRASYIAYIQRVRSLLEGDQDEEESGLDDYE